MDLTIKAFSAKTKALENERQIRVVVSTAAVDRVGDIVEQDGVDLAAYRANPVVLFNHNRDCPIASCVDIGVYGGELVATVEFPPAGVSAKADEVLGLIKAGVINAASIGFMEVEAEPIDKAKPRGGTRFKKVELYEFSFVTVPAVRDALVIERAAPGREKAAPRLTAKSLYDITAVAYALGELNWAATNLAWDSFYAEDGSPVPQQLFEVLNDLGAALIALTEEEVGKVLARWKDNGWTPTEDGGEVTSDMDEEDDAEMKAARARRLRQVEVLSKTFDAAA